MARIALVFRPPEAGKFSIEKVFEPISKMPDIEPFYLKVNLNSANNLFKIITQCVTQLDEEFIHVSGDVHYVCVILFWKKSILTIHDCNRYEQLKGIRKHLMGLIWFQLPLIFCNKCVVISDTTKNQLLKNFWVRRGKITTIPNSFSIPKIKSSVKRRNQKFTIISIGTKSNKNLLMLFKAVKDSSEVQLIVVGQLSKLQKGFLESENISYSNFHDVSEAHLSELYSKSDLLYFASTSEGFGLPILEAQALGVPVMTSNISSMPFVAGKGAHYVNPHDLSQIKHGIEKIITDELYRSKLIESGLKNINRFSKKEYLSRYRHLYKDVFKIDLSW